VIAYVLSRGRMLGLMFRDKLNLHEALLLGGALGLVGLTESLIPDSRIQYSTQGVFAAFATLAGGIPVGVITAAVVSLGAAIQLPRHAIVPILAVATSAAFAKWFRKSESVPARLICGFVCGALAQGSRLLVLILFAHSWHIKPPPVTAIFSIPVNGLGVVLLLLVVTDAKVRAESERRRTEIERHRLEAESARALASEAQLSALRARIHPHFLFNTLNSIAELCCIAPERAEMASINLSDLMRRTLETNAAAQVSLQEELELVRSYLQIERERLADRLCIVWQVDPDTSTVLLPPFSVQLLVENAINHGLSGKLGPGTVTVTARQSARGTLVAIQDDGIGISRTARQSLTASDGEKSHGLQILDQQLRILNGAHGRLRLYSSLNSGTLAAFEIPADRSVVRKGAR